MNTPNNDSKPSQGGDISEATNQTTTGNQMTNQLVCYDCKQAGHVKSECPKLQKKKSAEKDE